jgi:hypothetical protein
VQFVNLNLLLNAATLASESVSSISFAHFDLPTNMLIDCLPISLFLSASGSSYSLCLGGHP